MCFSRFWGYTCQLWWINTCQLRWMIHWFTTRKETYPKIVDLQLELTKLWIHWRFIFKPKTSHLSRHHISVSGFPFHHLHLQGDKRDQVFLQLQSSWQKLPTSLLQQNRTERHSSHHSQRLVDHRRCLGTEAFELSQSLLAHDVLHRHTKALPASPAPAAQWVGNTRNQCLKFMRIPMDLVPRRICVYIYIS